MIGLSFIGTLLLVLTTDADAARKREKTETRCLKVVKVNYCPTQISEYLLQTVAGKDESSFVCMNKFCDEEGEDSQCCKVKNAMKKDLQNHKLIAGFSPETLTKLREAVGLPSSPKLGPSEEPTKPIWESEAEKRAAQQARTHAALNATESDGCLCNGGFRNRGSFLHFKKGQLFSMQGDCSPSSACNECYRAGSDGGVYGCCLQTENGAATDCAPEFKKPKFGGEKCYCGRGGSTLKSTLFEEGQKHCFPDTDCKVCKTGCSNR